MQPSGAWSPSVSDYHLVLQLRSPPASESSLVNPRPDWSNAKKDWLAVSPHDCEERLVEQCKKIKTINPDVKCFVYRNTELALEWLSSQRAVMNEDHAGYFLNFQVRRDRHAPPPAPLNPPSPVLCLVPLKWLASVHDCVRTQGADASAKCTAAGPCTYSNNSGPTQIGDFCCPFANVYW